MILDLDKEDLIALIEGQFISYAAMDIPEVKKAGTYSDQYGSWKWEYKAFEDYSENELFKIYQQIKLENNK